MNIKRTLNEGNLFDNCKNGFLEQFKMWVTEHHCCFFPAHNRIFCINYCASDHQLLLSMVQEGCASSRHLLPNPSYDLFFEHFLFACWIFIIEPYKTHCCSIQTKIRETMPSVRPNNKLGYLPTLVCLSLISLSLSICHSILA